MKPEPIDDEALAAILQNEEAAAVGFHDGELQAADEVAHNFYNGELYGDEDEGRSQFVTRDVAEVVDHMTISVLKAFVSGDHVVEFEGHEKAKEVTAAIHYLFMRKQAGYRLVSDWLKGGLLSKISVIKTACVPETKVERETLEGVSAMQLTMLEEQGANVVAATETCADAEGPIYSVTIEQRVEKLTYPDYHIPLEEFRFRARTVSEETTGYLAHVCRKTRSDLVEMGFDPEVVYSLAHENGEDLSTNAYNRFKDEIGGWTRDVANNDPATQEVLLREEYIRIDRNGDGIAERLATHRVDDTILDAPEVDDQPFVVFCAFPMPHRMVGQSLAEKVMDIQRLRSVLWRQTLDNLYLTNAPRVFVDEASITENTIDDLLTVRPNGIVRYNGPNKPEAQTTPFAAGASTTMLEMAVGERESRTGITRMNQGLDRDALNKTASGTAMMMDAGQNIEEYVARNFGEALSRLFYKKYTLMKGRAEPFEVNIDGKPVMVDPRQWPDGLDMNVQVGLGTGKKDKRLALRMMLKDLQGEALQAGLPIVDAKRFYNSAAGIVADADLGSTDEYFIDPESPEAQQKAAQAAENPQPDPETMKVQADMQAKQAEMQMKQQGQQMDMQLRQQEGALKLQLAREEAQAKLQLQQEQAQLQAQLARDKAATEAELAREKMYIERDIAMETARMNATARVASEEAKLPTNRPGGDLDK